MGNTAGKFKELYDALNKVGKADEILESMKNELDRKTLTIPLWDCPALVNGEAYHVTCCRDDKPELRWVVYNASWQLRHRRFYTTPMGDEMVPVLNPIVSWMLAPSIPPYDGPAREVAV